MSLARGIYGVEYNPRQLKREPSGMGWIVALVVIVAVTSLTWTLVKRVHSSESAPHASQSPQVAETRDTMPPRAEEPTLKTKPMPPDPSLTSRPPKVRNLLMRLTEAERLRDIELAATTIETIRSLPGLPAADLDDVLARRLGDLNMQRLFKTKNAQWVKTVTIRRRDSPARIAAEHGSTLKSLTKLNGGNLENLTQGRRISVMNHPRFNLVIRRRSRAADLSLNGKFFKRYDLLGDVLRRQGSYRTPAKWDNAWLRKLGIQLHNEDRLELETLLPEDSPVMITEM